MESVVNSRQPNKVAVTLSRQINNGGLSAKTLYDDVYGGPPKFGVSSLSPRFEDYSEIFGSFHTPRSSSIPVLDLPVVDETEIFFDPRSAAFNYTEVFAACSGLDFAVSFDDLFLQPNGLDGVSSEEAWTPAEIDSFSGESDHSGNNQSISNGDLLQPAGGSTEFNISYHKVNGTSNEDMSKGKTHVTQLHTVPGCTVVYDETTRLHGTDPSFQVADDIDLNMEFNAEVMGNHLRKTKSHLHNFTSGEQTIASDLNLHNGFRRTGSNSSEMFLTVSDINLRSMPSQVPPPSRPPPVLDARKGDTSGFYSNSERVASVETPGDSPPPFFDVEVDVNSSAAASAAAAIKEAIHRAAAKLRSAKELKERKQGVYEGSVKSSYDVKNNEAKMNENMIRLNSLKDETMQVTCDRRYTKAKVSLTDERKTAPETLETLGGKGVLNKFEEKKMKESMSSQESDRSTGVGTWNEETEFFELVGTDETGKVIQPTKHTKSLLQDTGNHEHGRKEREASNMQEECKKVKAIEENYQVEEDKKKCKAAEEAYEHDKNIRRSKSSNVERRQREHVKKERVAEIFEQEENENNIRMAHQHGKTEKKVTEADQSGSLENVSETRHKEHKQLEMKKSKEVDRQTQSEVLLGMTLNENEKKLKEVEKQQQCVKRHMQSEKMKENGKGQREAFALGQVESKEKLKDSVEMEDFDERSKEAFKQDNTEEKEACKRENEMRLKLAKQFQNKKGLKEAHEREEIEKRQGSKKEGSDEGFKHTLRWEENEKKLKEDIDLEVNERRGNDEKEAFEQREKEAYEIDQNKKKFREVSDGHGEGNRFQGGDNKGIQKVLNQAPVKEKDSGVLNEDQSKRQIESSSNQAFDREGNVNVSNEESHPEQSEYIVKDAGRKEEDKGLNKALDQMEGNEEGKKMKFTKETDVTWEIESDENLLAAESASIHEESIVKLEVSQESVADHEIGNTRTECKAGENKLEEVRVENLLANEKIRTPETILGDAEHSGTQLGKLDDSMTEADDRRSTEAAEPATVQEAVNVQKTARWFHVGQSTERKEKSLNETPATVVKDAERMRRERELEKDPLRKIEEVRDREREREKDRMAVDKAMLEAEREREREKDRMAVDRATFEGCDRAYAEARERSERAAFERATVEAHQRALAEARERLEKAWVEARDKSYVDKAATEALWKAEHAAIERATAEAQERAMEKLKAERAAFQSRERLERSVSDKFGVCYRNAGRQGYSSSDMLDPQFQNSSSSAGSRYRYSSVYGASSFSERSEREGESAQRCRARLERYRRTAERAAKALAEKNMRDLLAQKEQAERNRLAETLDAEVKRWSSGKEGNLRALLSTLQYILGPDGGWQPIPLTEVITSAAVKKAYRKATLCVHPDKLQQRGASIPHKYICEKVFDLLKDAWNKFNSEER